MAQLSPALRNAMLDALETALGSSPKLQIYTGPPPPTTADAPTGTLLGVLDLPANWLTDAAAGQKLQAGSWQEDSAIAGGEAGYFRFTDTSQTTVGIQGVIGDAPAPGVDLVMVPKIVTIGQVLLGTSIVFTMGNAV